MYPGVICSAVHAATRCAFAITTLHPGSNLKNLAYEEGKKRGSLQQSSNPGSRITNGKIYGSQWLSLEARWMRLTGRNARNAQVTVRRATSSATAERAVGYNTQRGDAMTFFKPGLTFSVDFSLKTDDPLDSDLRHCQIDAERRRAARAHIQRQSAEVSSRP